MSKSITAKKFRPISIKRLQIEFNAMIARGQPCAKCGQTFPVMQCSHVHSTGSYPNLRFDVMNVLPMCGHHHNFWWHLEPSESWDWFKKEYVERHGEFPIYAAFNGFGQIMILADALDLANSDKPSELIKALEKGEFTSWNGLVTFERGEGPYWHQWSPPLMVLQYTEVGQSPKDAPILYPPKMKTGT